MVSTIVLALLLIQAALTGLPGPSSKQAGDLRTALQSHAANYSVSADTVVDALIEVAERFKIPIGIVWIRGKPSELKPIRLSWTDATVEQVVQDIVHTQRGYEIDVRNAVLHVRPRGLIPQRENFLRLRISRFGVENEVAEAASRQLVDLVNLQVAPPKPLPAGQSGGGMGFSQGVEVDDPQISISLAHVTVEDALDAISLVSPFKVWIVTFAPARNLTPTGFRRTMSPITAESHPYWELLQWGRRPY
jgi:hypothetical protein